MKAIPRDPSDLSKLEQWVRDEGDAKQRDRFRVVLLALRGGVDPACELEREPIARTVDRSRQFVDEWVGRYRKGGLDALRPRKRPGRTPFLDEGQKRELAALLDAGPREGEPRSVLFGQDVRETIHRRFGKLYSLSGVYHLLHGLGYSWLCPRPRHPRGDPAEQAAFKKRSWTTSIKSKRPVPTSGC